MLQPRYDLHGALLLRVDVTFLASICFQSSQFTVRFAIFLNVGVRSRKQSGVSDRCKVMPLWGRVFATNKWGGSSVSDRGVAQPNLSELHTGFKRRCYQRSEKLADDAMGSENYIEASEHFSTMLSLDTEDRVDILIKRSRARAMLESWEDALRDADEVYSVFLSP